MSEIEQYVDDWLINGVPNNGNSLLYWHILGDVTRISETNPAALSKLRERYAERYNRWVERRTKGRGRC